MLLIRTAYPGHHHVVALAVRGVSHQVPHPERRIQRHLARVCTRRPGHRRRRLLPNRIGEAERHAGGAAVQGHTQSGAGVVGRPPWRAVSILNIS
eukprot:COSAG01_NODE_17276_length_1164_cov_1.259155_2_plen_95_part_00